ncbi:MAG: ArsR family transcriptional regulator [Proteobacteria bacterium]|nr:MAG: ArsR family transcriptional regulator [Pseudomonadota bacterium]
MSIALPILFSCMADATRLRILALLGQEGELCVCEIVHALSDIQPKISRHLAILRKEGVVIDDRDGTRVFYQLSPQLPDWIQQMILRVAEEAATEPPYRDDLARLESMPNRPTRSQVA